MANPSIQTTRHKAHKDIEKLETILNSLEQIPISLQYLISEVVLIRAASVFEYSIAELAYKLSSGATYLDGSRPRLLHNCSTIGTAREAMLSHGRDRRIQNLKWTKAQFIKSSVGNVIDLNDHFCTTCDTYGANIAEIFKVRNFAAHKNTVSKNNYKQVIRVIYGRERNMQLGFFLLSDNYVPLPNLKRYLVEIKVIVDQVTKS